jgi:saccharopine dehydrogenase-like NADP-dependent oxidoreductase
MAGRIPNMKEKTLRYPGHIAYIQELQRTGMPWVPDVRTPDDDKDEFTIMRITIHGFKRREEKKFSYTLFDAYDPTMQVSSMSRTTGYTCTGVARCVLGGVYRHAGISPPSYIGESMGCVYRIFTHLREHGIVLLRNEEPLM